MNEAQYQTWLDQLQVGDIVRLEGGGFKRLLVMITDVSRFSVRAGLIRFDLRTGRGSSILGFTVQIYPIDQSI
jgi:hypothetical protein